MTDTATRQWNREEKTAAHLVALALWMQEQREPFTFLDVRAAFPRAYEGTVDAVDRKWTRHKRALQQLGVGLEYRGHDSYLVERGGRSRLVQTRAGLARLAAVVRALPSPAGLEHPLEAGLRKLAAQGAPILEVLVARRSATPSFLESLCSLELAGACLLLLETVLAEGPEGLCRKEAAAACGAANDASLNSVLRVLLDLTVPLEAPMDCSGVDVYEDRVACYLPLRQVRPLRLTVEETEAVEAAVMSVVPVD